MSSAGTIVPSTSASPAAAITGSTSARTAPVTIATGTRSAAYRTASRVVSEIVEPLTEHAVLRAPDADDRDRTLPLVQHRGRHAEERLLELADTDAVALAAYRVELLLEVAPRRDRRVRVAREPRRRQRLA